MKQFALAAAAMLALSFSATFAEASNIRVAPGHFCAQNKCVRFSRDLNSVSIQGRRAVSVASYRLRSNPVISTAEFREIFYLALRQRGVNGTRG